MILFKKNFAILNKKFLTKKEYFKTVINRYWKKGDLRRYKESSALLDLLENYSKQISEGGADHNILKNKCKEFRRAYKKLNEMAKPVWRQWIEAIVVAGGLVFILRTFLFVYHS